MILFVVGNNHAIAAQAVNRYNTAGEDKNYNLNGNSSHPANLAVSWANKLANALKMKLTLSDACNTNEEIRDSINNWINSVSRRLTPDEIFIIAGWNDTNNTDEVDIRNYHIYLDQLQIKHIFFSTYIKLAIDYNFRDAYVDWTYIDHIRNKNMNTVIMSDTYYGADAHAEWANYLLNHIVKNSML